MKDAILEGGIAFDKAYGVNAFDYHGTDLRFNQVFNRGLFNHSTFFMKKILETYDGFQGLNTVVDVGGGTGAVLRMIVSKYPSIKGINFDLPHVIADATPFPGKLSLSALPVIIVLTDTAQVHHLKARPAIIDFVTLQVWSTSQETCSLAFRKEKPSS